MSGLKRKLKAKVEISPPKVETTIPKDHKDNQNWKQNGNKQIIKTSSHTKPTKIPNKINIIPKISKDMSPFHSEVIDDKNFYKNPLLIAFLIDKTSKSLIVKIYNIISSEEAFISVGNSESLEFRRKLIETHGIENVDNVYRPDQNEWWTSNIRVWLSTCIETQSLHKRNHPSKKFLFKVDYSNIENLVNQSISHELIDDKVEDSIPINDQMSTKQEPEVNVQDFVANDEIKVINDIKDATVIIDNKLDSIVKTPKQQMLMTEDSLISDFKNRIIDSNIINEPSYMSDFDGKEYDVLQDEYLLNDDNYNVPSDNNIIINKDKTENKDSSLYGDDDFDQMNSITKVQSINNLKNVSAKSVKNEVVYENENDLVIESANLVVQNISPSNDNNDIYDDLDFDDHYSARVDNEEPAYDNEEFENHDNDKAVVINTNNESEDYYRNDFESEVLLTLESPNLPTNTTDLHGEESYDNDDFERKLTDNGKVQLNDEDNVINNDKLQLNDDDDMYNDDQLQLNDDDNVINNDKTQLNDEDDVYNDDQLQLNDEDNVTNNDKVKVSHKENVINNKQIDLKEQSVDKSTDDINQFLGDLGTGGDREGDSSSVVDLDGESLQSIELPVSLQTNIAMMKSEKVVKSNQEDQ